jgi:hypothetical protein
VGHSGDRSRITGGEDAPQPFTGGVSLAGNGESKQGNCRHAAPTAKLHKRIELAPTPAGVA